MKNIKYLKSLNEDIEDIFDKKENIEVREKHIDYEIKINELMETRSNLQKRVYFLDIIMQNLDKDDLLLIKYRYFDRLSVIDVCYKMFLSEATFYRRQRDILEKLSKKYIEYRDLFN
ncbi:MAG: DUF1492 domain-containing protein [Tissierellia bacterium]|nr:DUF1492 domain-containing protein [Tissierellia bacterium]